VSEASNAPPIGDQTLRADRAMSDFLERTPQLFYVLDMLFLRLDEMFLPRLHAAGISRHLWLTFRQIEGAPGLTQTELARRLSRDKVRVGRELDELEKKSLIQRVQSKDDRRAKRIYPVFGKKIMKLMQKLDREAFDAAFRNVSTKEIEIFLSVMLRMVEDLESPRAGHRTARAASRASHVVTIPRKKV
jgi:DNA-binding MarR family transcriptional regulator